MLAVAGVVAAIGAVLFAVLILRDSGLPSTETTTSPFVAAPVPGLIASSGKLAVAVNVPYEPNEFKDPSGNIVGFEIDLMNAVASALVGFSCGQLGWSDKDRESTRSVFRR